MIPTEDASDDAREEFMGRLSGIEGVMRTPENYTIAPENAEAYQFDTVEGFTGDESIGELKVEALRLGMTQDQANGMHKWLAENIVANSVATESQNEMGMAELKGIWGQAFPHKMQGIENTIHTLSQKIPSLKDASRTPEFVQLMDLVGGMLGEAGVIKQDPRQAMTPAEARQRIDEIRSNPDHPANSANSNDMGYEKARGPFLELYKIANMH